MTSSAFSETTRPHMAARCERWLSRIVATQLRRRGRLPVVETYIGLGNTSTIRIVARVLLRRPIDNFEPRRKRWRKLRGWRRFLTAEVPGVTLRAKIGGVEFLLKSDEDGYIDADLAVELEPGWHDVVLETVAGRQSLAPVLVIDPATPIAIVSDIDDTVIVTDLPRPFVAAWNALVRPEIARRPVPGMSGFFESIRTVFPGTPVIYLSTGAWNVAPAIEAFVDRYELPEGPALLTDWGPTNTGWFRSGLKHKVESLERLRAMFPNTAWILVGDDGQHDPHIYAQFAARHPEQTAAIAIRRLTPAEGLLAHGLIAPTPLRNTLAADIPVVYGEHGADLRAGLARAGLAQPATGPLRSRR